MSTSEHKSAAEREDEAPQSFKFVLLTDPVKRSADVRKEVRSHVTSRQHRISRLKKTRNRDAARTSTTAGSSSSQQPDSRDAEGSRQHSGVQSSTTSGQSQDLLKTILSPEVIVRSGPLASRTSRMTLLNDPDDSVARLLGNMRLSYNAVIEHYSWIVTVQSTDWQKQFMPNAPPGAGYQVFFPGVAKDPAFLATAVLVATGHLLTVRKAPVSQNTIRCIYELRDFVIRTINKAIQDPERALSISLLAAVLIIASNEALQGSPANYHIHMKGLVKMINLRGGLSRLNDEQPYMREFIIWQDTNVATIMGCKPYHLLADGAEDAPSVVPDTQLWTAIDSVPKPNTADTAEDDTADVEEEPI